MFLNEDRFLDLEMENLKALLARAAAAVPQAADGSLPRGKKHLPTALPARGDAAGRGALRGKQLVLGTFSRQVCLSHAGAEGSCRARGRLLPTHAGEVGFCRDEDEATGSCGEGTCSWETRRRRDGLLGAALAGSTLTAAFPRGGPARLCPAPSRAQAVGERSQHNLRRSVWNCSELEEAGGFQGRDCRNQPAK